MQDLRDNVDQDEGISDNRCNPNKQRYMRQIVIDFGFLIEHWEIENKNPSKKLLNFNEYLFLGIMVLILLLYCLDDWET